MNTKTFPRILALGAGCTLLLGVGTAAVAETTQQDASDVQVNVDIAKIDEPGVLAMSVAGGSMTLAEKGSTELIRQFTGSLPTVTVTDTRSAEQIPDGAAWYVLGSASSFTAGSGSSLIDASHLGWAPKLIDGGDSGLVTEGEEVGTVVDQAPDNVGLVDQELLAMAFDSQAVHEEGSWSVGADLFLRTGADVVPGSYTSKLTLSLFE